MAPAKPKLSDLFSRSLLDDIEAEDPTFNRRRWTNLQTRETVEDMTTDLLSWRQAVQKLLHAIAEHAVEDSVEICLLQSNDESNMFTSFYSSAIQIRWERLGQELKRVGNAPEGDVITTLLRFDSLVFKIGLLTKFIGYLLLADKHSVLRRVRSLALNPLLIPRGVFEYERCIKNRILVDSLCFDFTAVTHLRPFRMRPVFDYLFEGLVRKLLTKAVENCAYIPASIYLSSVVPDENNFIGGGGFADVYRGDWSGKAVALKVPRLHVLDHKSSETIYREVLKEVVLWATLYDSNIVPLYGLFILDSGFSRRIAMVSPFMKNGNLRQYLKKSMAVDRLQLIKDIVRGIRYLHNQVPPIVHGDIRCANVLVDDGGGARLTDFGLSKVESTYSSMTGSSTRGSMRWMAPELLLPMENGGDGRHTTSTDIYAFSMTCIEVFTDEVPFFGFSEAMVIGLVAHKKERPPRPANRMANAMLTDGAWDVITSCWRSSADERPIASEIEF